MAVLFHQNMNIFGGGVAANNAAFHQQFAAISGALGGAGPVAAAGFTEVKNNGAAAAAFGTGGVGGGLCAALGINHVANIACGRTALTAKPEYVAIGVHATYPIQRIGRMLINITRRGALIFNDIAPMPLTAAWCNNLPGQGQVDFRGVVYVVLQTPGLGGVNFAVGFLHNMYTLISQRLLTMLNLPCMMAGMGAAAGGQAAIACGAKYIGGDFNAPYHIGHIGTLRTGRIYYYGASLAAAPVNPPAPNIVHWIPPPWPGNFIAGGTTWRGSYYDYWFSSIDPAGVPPAAPFIIPVAAAYGETLDSRTGVLGGRNKMSDHCGIGLRIT